MTSWRWGCLFCWSSSCGCVRSWKALVCPANVYLQSSVVNNSTKASIVSWPTTSSLAAHGARHEAQLWRKNPCSVLCCEPAHNLQSRYIPWPALTYDYKKNKTLQNLNDFITRSMVETCVESVAFESHVGVACNSKMNHFHNHSPGISGVRHVSKRLDHVHQHVYLGVFSHLRCIAVERIIQTNEAKLYSAPQWVQSDMWWSTLNQNLSRQSVHTLWQLIKQPCWIERITL